MTEPDADLAERAKRGDLTAFAALVTRYERSVRSVALARLPDAQLCEDVAQEAFVAAYRALGDLRDPVRFGAWLMQIVRRTADRHRRDRASAPAVVSLGDDAEAIAERSTALDRDAQTRRDRLLEEIERLPEQERLVVAMHYFDGHPLREIAEMFGEPVGTVTKRLSRAYERLRGRLANLQESCNERT